MKNIYLSLLLISFFFKANAQNLQTKIDEIVAEGKLLYKSEMASWYASDLFVEQYHSKEKIAGYFSYSEADVSKCIFFSNEADPQVIGTVEFDSLFNIETAIVDIEPRNFNEIERKLYELFKKSLELINNDPYFKTYQNSNLNLVPLITKDSYQVFVLTGPSISNVVIFGNDYLIKFDKKLNFESRKKLHNDIIPIEYKTQDGDYTRETIHSHNDETGPYMTSTDVCTLMLYSKFTQWKQHTVFSKEYTNFWNCQENQLYILPTKKIREIIESSNSDNDKKAKSNKQKQKNKKQKNKQ